MNPIRILLLTVEEMNAKYSRMNMSPEIEIVHTESVDGSRELLEQDSSIKGLIAYETVEQLNNSEVINFINELGAKNEVPYLALCTSPELERATNENVKVFNILYAHETVKPSILEQFQCVT